MPHIGPRKYAPLTQYLAGLAADEVTLTFAELEAILGTALPPSARAAPFWANLTDSWQRSAQAAAWRRAGWRVAVVNVGLGMVTFARVLEP
jgi:hypothetical protein